MKILDLHNPPNTNPDREGIFRIPNWILFLLFLIPIMVYLPGILGKIPYPSESAPFTDLILTHYPYALYLKQSLLEYHQIPFWSNIIHSGAPFAANPLAGLFYLPGWLAILFPLPEGISVALAMHAVFGSWGMYLFLKKENSNNIGAVAGALCFGLMPKIAAHYGAGHVTLIYAIYWTPWLFYTSKKDQVGWKTGIAAAMLFLADPRWAVYAGLFWFTYDIAHRHYLEWKDYLWFYLKSGLNAVLIASPLILPLSEFTRLSTRTNLDLADIQLYAFPPQKLLGVLIPAPGSNPEWYVYAGGIILGLVIFQVWNTKTKTNTRFWIIWIIISFLFSFGSWIIKPTWLVNIPILSLLRVPARILFLIGFCLSAITAITLQEFVDKKPSVNISRLVGYGLVIFSFLMTIGILSTAETTPLLTIWGFLFLLLAGCWLILCSTNLNRNGLAWIFIGLVVVDLLGAGIQGIAFKNKIELFDKEAVNFLINDPGIFRIYSPSYSIPQHLAAEYSLEMVDGVDPLQIASYAEYMTAATGVGNDGYSVTIPPFSSGNPATDNLGTTPDPEKLGLLNVKYVISDFEVNSLGLIKAGGKFNKNVYLNEYWRERAWLEGESGNAGISNQNGILVKNEPNRIFLEVNGPGKLILSEIVYPGWKATVDGNRVRIEAAYEILRSVSLSEGLHKVQFNFQPETVYTGIGLAILGWAISIWQSTKKTN